MVDERWLARVPIAFTDSSGIYRALRVLEELRAAGWSTSQKRIVYLRREDGLQARARRRRRVDTTYSDHAEPIAPNLLAR